MLAAAIMPYYQSHTIIFNRIIQRVMARFIFMVHCSSKAIEKIKDTLQRLELESLLALLGTNKQ